VRLLLISFGIFEALTNRHAAADHENRERANHSVSVRNGVRNRRRVPAL